MKHLEDALQASVVAALRLNPDLRVLAIPNGGKRNIMEASRLKSQGVLAGASDLMVVWGPHAEVAFVELKAPGLINPKRPLACLRASQLAWHGFCQLSGFNIAVCDSLDGVLEFLRDCGAPVKARLAS